MISAVVKYSFSSEIDEVWTPRPLAGAPDPFVLDLGIGPVGDATRDDFSVLVGSSDALTRFPGAKVLAIEDLPPQVQDTAALVALLEQRVARCQGEDWSEVVECLRAFLVWEYDDYRPDL